MTVQILRSHLTEIEKSEGIGRLLELWLEVGRICHLKCSFCFNDAGNAEPVVANQLSIEEYRRILQEFAALGGKSVGIPGFGEPFHRANLSTTMAIIAEASRLGLRVNVFTTGDRLTEELGWKLRDHKVSLSVKFNSRFEEVQDKLVGVRGYTKKRQRALEMLYRLGFNRPDTDGRSLLAFVTSIIPGANEKELPGNYYWCRTHNVVPDVDTLLPLGRAKPMTDEEAVVTRQVFERLREIDRRNFGIEWIGDSPTYAGACCDRCRHHLYVGMTGDIGPCLGAYKRGVTLGNARDISLETAWNSPLMQRIRAREYSGKCLACARFQSSRCNSCLGRFASEISAERVETLGCWNLAE